MREPAERANGDVYWRRAGIYRVMFNRRALSTFRGAVPDRLIIANPKFFSQQALTNAVGRRLTGKERM